MTHDRSAQRDHLDQRASDALDALVEAGFDPAGVAAPRSADAQAIARLLSLLDADMPEGAPLLSGTRARDARLLVNVTAARVNRSRERDCAGAIGADAHRSHLAPIDAEELDALVAAGWQDAEQDTRVASLLNLLDGELPSDERRSHLIEATLSRVQAHIDEHDSRMRLQPEPIGARARWRFREVAAVAAAVLFGSAALSPLLSPPSEFTNRAGISLPEGLGVSRHASPAEAREPQYDLGLPSPELRFEVDSRFGASLSPVIRLPQATD